MKTLEWLPTALEDLHRLHAFVAQQSVSAAHNLIDALIDGAESIEPFPERGRPREPELIEREPFVRFGS